MSLNKAFKGKILRPIDSATLGIFIKSFQAIPEVNSVILSVRYFNLEKSEDGMSEDVDMITMNVVDFMSQYYIMSNADTASSFLQAEWKPVDEYLNSWLDEQEGEE